jgi:DNA-binding CsgD family transcriptional regulator/PAS domain-containing protein
MDVVRTANELLPRLYTAACGEGEWTDFLGPLSEITRSRIAHVLSATVASNPAPGRSVVPQRQWIRQVGISEEALRILGEVGKPDPWIAALSFGDYREGWVGRDVEMVPRHALEATDYYKKILRPLDYERIVGLLLLKRPGEIAVAGLARGAGDPEFEDDVVELMRLLCPHLAAAVRVYNRVGSLEDTVESLEVALEQFAIGVVVLDREAQVIFANQFAMQRLVKNNGILLEQGRLRATVAGETRQLHEQIERAIEMGETAEPGGTARPSVSVTAVSRQQGSPLHLFVTTWSSKRKVALRRPAAVVLITEPERGVPRETWLQTLYDLTPAESKLATLISGGMHGPEAARTLGLSTETVRSRLKTVFSKTNTKRQSDLARLLASLPRS